MTSRIKKLDTQVVNRIAAGEIVIGPSNALKELLENSIDAKSNRIDVLCKEGGLKLLQLTDNGSGIDKDDLGILCERHTTSKLTNFKDLESIATYGFRGEALASISHISHLSVTTKQAESSCAFRAKYQDGKLLDEPKAIAGNNGTQISVEDLFYNYEARLRSFKSANEEYQKVLEVTGKYAIHSTGIGMSCKRAGDTHPSLSIQKDWSVVDRIRSFYGSTVANELMEVEITPNEKFGVIGGTCQVTNANYSAKKSTPYIMFINHRLVTCEPLRRALAQAYSTFLPKGGYPFVYISLEINPADLDVNVHPTKREVRFSNEDEVVEHVCLQVQQALSRVDSSRAFKTQTILPGSVATPKATLPPKSSSYAYNQVRTDYSQRTITSMFGSQFSQQANSPTVPVSEKKDYKPVNLGSVKRFRQQVIDSAHRSLTQIFAEHTYIGVVDYTRRLSALQHSVRLYLVDYGQMCRELFYQIALSEFNNFGVIDLEEKLSLRELLGLEMENEDDIDVVIELFRLEEKREMLAEYFSLTFEDTDDDLLLSGLPLLLTGYNPPPANLPNFFAKISGADWTSEEDCLKTIATELAILHCPESLPDDDPNYETDRVALATSLEHVIFPAAKRRLTAPKDLGSSVVEVASLPGLYKVFERC